MTPRGGNREGAGRKSRPHPKALSVWCGQITQEQRDLILRWLSPDERFQVLWAAANNRLQADGAFCACEQPLGDDGYRCVRCGLLLSRRR